MAEWLERLAAQAGPRPALLLDHAGFARRAFGSAAPDAPDDPTTLMGALSQANQLLNPEAHWVSLLDLLRHTAPGRAALAGPEAAPLPRLRALCESSEVDAALNRLLQSARSAAGPGRVLLLDFASPADWIAATGTTPHAELDDLDAEDIAVFQSNLALRLDLSGVVALSVSGAWPIAGALAESFAPLANFASHHGLGLALLDAPEEATSPEGAERLATTPWDGPAPEAGPLFLRVPPDTAPQKALQHVNALRDSANNQ